MILNQLIDVSKFCSCFNVLFLFRFTCTNLEIRLKEKIQNCYISVLCNAVVSCAIVACNTLQLQAFQHVGMPTIIA